MNRNYVYAFPSAYGTCNVVNYSGNSTVNSFLTPFEVWGGHGIMKLHDEYSENPWPEFWFECSKEFFNMFHAETFDRAFKKMGVELVFKYPFKNK